MIGQLEEGKHPFFQRGAAGENDHSGQGINDNGRTVALLKQLGAEVKQID